jgi:hypothetical protein
MMMSITMITNIATTVCTGIIIIRTSLCCMARQCITRGVIVGD